MNLPAFVLPSWWMTRPPPEPHADGAESNAPLPLLMHSGSMIPSSRFQRGGMLCSDGSFNRYPEDNSSICGSGKSRRLRRRLAILAGGYGTSCRSYIIPLTPTIHRHFPFFPRHASALFASPCWRTEFAALQKPYVPGAKFAAYSTPIFDFLTPAGFSPLLVVCSVFEI